jgi:glycosyltransferase involved in cell wall biosynthesis
MKLLYIVPNLNNGGGVARVLSIKTNFLIEKFSYEVHILTQNDGNSSLFYSFNEKIILHDIILKGANIQFFNNFRKSLNKQVATINPDIIIVCDNGLKAFTIPFILNTKTPIIFECHGSRFIEEFDYNGIFFLKFLRKLKYRFKFFGASKFNKTITLSEENRKEWSKKNSIIIPNPIGFETYVTAKLHSKKAIVVSRHAYEKGIDRLLFIWKKVISIHPDWILEIYGKSEKNNNHSKLANTLNLKNNVSFFEPVNNINEKYLEASMCLMASRYEGIPMVLIEAMASGLPCITYDCPCGPRAVVNNNYNGFLIENSNENEFVKAVCSLIEDENLRIQMGKNAKESTNKYKTDAIMKLWNELFIELVSKKNN